MKTVGLALLVAVLTSQQAYGWGAVAGPYGGAAYRGPIVQGCARHPAQRLSGDRMAAWRFEAQPTTMGIQPVLSRRALQQERLPEPPWPPRVPTTPRPIIRLTIPDDGKAP
jgi:hypothetical protein